MGADLYIKLCYGGDQKKDSYYRDSYNNTNLLWQLGLDYWVWFAGFLNKKRELTPAKTKKVLEIIRARHCVLDGKKELYKKEWCDYFNEKYDELVGFLEKAIELKSNIEASI